MSKVLIVEDDASTAELIKFTLEGKGYDILLAGDGGEAVKKVRTDMPDLIILDIMLPTMDGFQVCQILKHNQAYQKIPIIILSAKIKKEDVDKGFETGADDYITKPFDPKHLMERIQLFISKSGN